MIMQELVPMTSGIYMMTNKVNGRRYIGYSENIEQRWEFNIDELNRGTFAGAYLGMAAWLDNWVSRIEYKEGLAALSDLWDEY